jgi:hypothetical protein
MVLSIGAFGNYISQCETIFPCNISKLYSATFTKLPIFGALISLYPIANIAPLSIQSMTMSMSLHSYLGGKYDRRWISASYAALCTIIVIMVRDVGKFQVYAGGIAGVTIAYGIPGLAGWY